MSSSLTTTQIQSLIRRKILEETSDLVSDKTILLNANLAYDELAIRTATRDQIKQATITLTNGVGTLPADFGAAYGPGYKSATDRTKFQEKTISGIDGDQIGYGFAINDGQIIVTPDSTSQIIIRYYPTYTALSSAQNPEINSYFHELIAYGAIWRIYEDLQDEATSEFYREKFEDMFTKKYNAISHYQEDNVDGNVMFNGIRVI